MIKIRWVLSLAMLLMLGSAAAEEVRYYDIELIVFESLDQEARNSEVWKHESTMQKPERFVELGQPYPGPIPKIYSPKLTFRPLHKKYFQLTEEAGLLEKDAQYRVLLHTAWRQPGMDAESALPVHIHRTFIQTNNAPPQAGQAGQSTYQPYYSQTQNKLDGYVKIILSRYLHADIDLTYTTKIPVGSTNVITTTELENQNTELAVSRPVVYHLAQTRKMRSQEVHYIDHPIIGVIVLATPYQPAGKKQ